MKLRQDFYLIFSIFLGVVLGFWGLSFLMKFSLANYLLMVPIYFYIIVFFLIFLFGLIFNKTEKSNEMNRYFYKIIVYAVMLLFFVMFVLYSYIFTMFIVDADYLIVYTTDYSSLQLSLLECFFLWFLSLVSFLFFVSYIPIFRTNIVSGILPYELIVIMLLGIFGMFIILLSGDLLIMLVGLELLGLSSYLLAGFNRLSSFSSEGSLKYFILGAVSSSFLMLGCCLIYGEFGVISFNSLSQIFLLGYDVTVTFYFALILLFSGLLFKLGAVPYYSWLPDVYEGSPFYVTSYFLILPKISIFGLLVKLIYFVFFPLYEYWSYIFLITGVLSIFIGVLGAIKQVYSLRRFFAYTSISHTGYMLVTLSTPSFEMGLKSLTIYLVFYTFLTLLFFSLYLGFVPERKVEYLDNFLVFREISYSYPIFGLILMSVMLSFIGIPFFSGFFMKYYLLYNVFVNDYMLLTLFILVFSTIAGVYYIRILISLYYSKVTSDIYISPLNYKSTLVIVYGFLINFFSLYFITWVIDFIKLIFF